MPEMMSCEIFYRTLEERMHAIKEKQIKCIYLKP